MATIASKDTSGTLSAGIGETVVERTRGCNRFSTAIPGQFRIGATIGPINYPDDPFAEDPNYIPIDLDVVLTPGENWDAVIESNGYQVRFWNGRVISGKTVRYIAQFRRAGKWIAMAPLALVWENDAGQRELISKAQAVGTPVIDNDAHRVTWPNVFGSGLDFRYNLRPDEFFKTLIVNDKTDLPVPTIGGPGLKLTLVMALSWHSQSKAINGFAGSITPDELPDDSIDDDAPDEALIDPDAFGFQDELLRDTFWMKRPRAWDNAEEQNSISMEWQLRRKGSYVFALLSTPASALDNPAVVYPVYIDVDIGEEQVGASTDDCSRRYTTPGFFITSGSIVVGNISAGLKEYCNGLRFTTIPIPASTIDSASIIFTCDGSVSGTTVRTRIRGEDVDDAPTFSDQTDWDARFPGGVTAAQTTWDSVGAWILDTEYTSPDIASVIQEIVDRGGWASGQDIVIFWDDFEDRSDVGAYRRAYAYDSDTAKAAKFNASYTVAGGNAPTAIFYGPLVGPTGGPIG